MTTLLLLYAIDLFVPGPETLLIVSMAGGSKAAGYGVALGSSFMTLIYKVVAVMGFVVVINVLPGVFVTLQYLSVVFFIAFAVLLLRRAFINPEIQKKVKVVTFSKAFSLGLVCGLINPFALAATMTLLALTMEKGMNVMEALVLALTMAAMNLTWVLFVAWSGSTALARVIVHPVALKVLSLLASCAFLGYAIRFALGMQ
ncbi:MAG: LysE family transporter [Alphaproteobacteria bacterium]|nr:LysE family transporter [Alphaproteobacteria bacterium]